MGILNRSAIVATPRQPFLDWLHGADPTSHHISLRELVHEPRIYLIRECETDEDVDEGLRDLCEEIFTEQLDGWYGDPATWPKDLSFDVFCLCDESLIAESD